jgi:hypothetical protein
MLQYGRIRRQQRRIRSALRYHRPSVFVTWMVVMVQWFQYYPQPTTGFFLFRFFNPCRSTNRLQRCGLFNLSVLMHIGDANTDQCVETCVFFPNVRNNNINGNLNCGSCTILENFNTTQPGYNIYVDLINITGIGNGTFFAQARDRWQQVITSDLVDIGLSGLDYRPSSRNCTPPSVIDDLYICALYTTIDGRGTILGSAGPIKIRLIDSLPIIGEMKFDYADIYNLQQKNNFQNVILHEMAHVLGMCVFIVVILLLLLF